jgi:hypothetical protein
MKRRTSYVIFFGFSILMIGGCTSQEMEIESLISQLADTDLNVRTQAVKILSEIGEPAVPPLIAALRDEHESVQMSAATALGKIGEPAKAAVPALVEALDDKSAKVRGWATWALGRIGEPSVPMLIELIGDEDTELRRSAVSALEVIGTSEGLNAVNRIKLADYIEPDQVSDGNSGRSQDGVENSQMPNLDNFGQLRQSFQSHTGQVRLIALLSPN